MPRRRHEAAPERSEADRGGQRTVQKANVRTLHVQAPAAVQPGPTTTTAAAPAPATPLVPVERRPSPNGYRRAIEAHCPVTPPSRVDPGINEVRATEPGLPIARTFGTEPRISPAWFYFQF